MNVRGGPTANATRPLRPEPSPSTATIRPSPYSGWTTVWPTRKSSGLSLAGRAGGDGPLGAGGQVSGGHQPELQETLRCVRGSRGNAGREPL